MASNNDALSLAEQAEARAAEAEAQAAAARAHAEDLRAQKTGRTAETTAGVTTELAGADEDDAPADPRRMPMRRTLATAVAALLAFALVAANGLMLWHGYQASQRRAQEAEFTAAAKQGVVNLLSLDFNKGDGDIKRLIDSTTGDFRADFEKSQNDFLTVMKDAKVVTNAAVKATAVESMTKDSAHVLVVAASQVSNSASAQQSARGWRLAVTVQRDNGQLKMSKVEFVP